MHFLGTVNKLTYFGNACEEYPNANEKRRFRAMKLNGENVVFPERHWTRGGMWIIGHILAVVLLKVPRLQVRWY